MHTSLSEPISNVCDPEPPAGMAEPGDLFTKVIRSDSERRVPVPTTNKSDGLERDEMDGSQFTREETCYHQCWSCWKEFSDGEGISIDDTGMQQICPECWEQIPVTSRMVLGLLFRRIDHGGAGLKDLIQDALDAWPFAGMRQSRN